MEAFASISNPQIHSFPADEVVVVTGPHCLREESDGTIQVASATCESVELSPAQSKCIRRVDQAAMRFVSVQEEDIGDDDAVELQEGTQQQQSPLASSRESGGDSPREHGYKYAYTQDEYDDHTHILDLDMSTFCTSMGGLSPDPEQQYPPIHILGKSYHRIHDYEARRSDESNLFWFTYRCDFPEISPYRISTDAGWGCMLRSAQMMLAQALRMHFKGRSWQPPSALAKRRTDPFVGSILNWFADYPSRQECVFSLHNMVAAGLAKYDVFPGEWYGPGTAAYVMRDLVELYEHQQIQHVGTEPIFRVHVASQGTVYRDAVDDLMTKYAQEERRKQVIPTRKTEPLHPLDPLHMAEKNQESTTDLNWDTALLLLIPLRLGLKTFNPEYTTGLTNIFSLPQSVGVLGGRPRGARWFYGASADGKLYGLDPHTIQMAPQRRHVPNTLGKMKLVVALTDDYLRSVHTTNTEAMPLERVDPSLALGFYCKNRGDFDALCQSLVAWNKLHSKVPELFTMADATPDYSANASSAMHEMMLSMTGEEADDDGLISDDDEYVLL